MCEREERETILLLIQLFRNLEGEDDKEEKDEEEKTEEGEEHEEEGHGNASNNESGWAPLLLAFMYEYTKKDSMWAPYFAILPTPEQLQHPHFWAKEELDILLAGTGLVC